MTRKILKFATEAHGEQTRKYTGLPYITHPVSVAERVRLQGGDLNQQAAALLHDVLEDTSNPELANAVYEAAGFNNNVVFKTEKGSVYYLNNGKTKRDKKTLTGRTEKFSESDKTVYITEEDFKTLRENSEGLKDLEWSDDSVTVTNDSNRKTTISVKSNPEIGLIPLELVKGIEETETGYREDKRINIKSYSFLPNGVTFHAGHKIVSISNQITPQQKQQVQQLYSQYLESLNKPNTNPILQGNQQEQVKKFAELQERLNNKEFLEGAKNAYESSKGLQEWGTQEQYNDYIARVSLGIIKNPTSGEYNYISKVKDIVYHGTNKEFDKFKKPSDTGSQNRMIAFADDIEYAKIAGARRTPLKRIIAALVNITKPYPVDKLEAMELDSGYRDEVLNEIKKEGVDGFAFESDDDLATKNFNEVLVFEPEQIHILGGKQDIEGFREFVLSTQAPSLEVFN